VQSLAERALDLASQWLERVGALIVGDQHHLHARGAPLDHHLEVAQHPAVRAVGIRRDAGPAECGLGGGRHLVHQRVVNEAVGDVDDAVRSLLEDADLGGGRSPANREAGAMPVAERCTLHDGRRRQAGVLGQRGKQRARAARDAGFAEAGTAGAGRAVWTRRDDGRTSHRGRPCRRRGRVVNRARRPDFD